MKRHSFASIFLVLLTLSLFLVSCSNQASRAQLMVYSPHGSDLLEAFKTRFEAANPNVEVRYLDMGSQEIYDRIKIEQANPQADIWWGAAAATFDKAAAEGLLEPYKPSWSAQVEADWHDSQDRWYGTFQTPEVIVYNKVAVKAEESPKDWDDVLDPKWSGKLLIRDPLRSDTMRTIFGAMILRQSQPGSEIEKGYEWLKKLDANTKEYTVDGTALVQKLARQEGLVSLWDLPDVALAINRQNLPLAFNIPTSGTPVVIDAIAVVKGSRNPELARKFYEFVTSEESLLLAASEYFHPPLRKDIDPKKLPAWLSGVEIKAMSLNQSLMRSEIDKWMLHWDTQIRNQNKK
ncbi:MAG: extracellular solute-binding protein [Blastocatellia bacterium]|nr:extracellular solute-binding protein [Blastocatellia bacterium]